MTRQARAAGGGAWRTSSSASRKSDRQWAHWVAQELSALHHEPHVPDWEIVPGEDIVGWMEKRHDQADYVTTRAPCHARGGSIRSQSVSSPVPTGRRRERKRRQRISLMGTRSGRRGSASSWLWRLIGPERAVKLVKGLEAVERVVSPDYLNEGKAPFSTWERRAALWRMRAAARRNTRPAPNADTGQVPAPALANARVRPVSDTSPAPPKADGQRQAFGHAPDKGPARGGRPCDRRLARDRALALDGGRVAMVLSRQLPRALTSPDRGKSQGGWTAVRLGRYLRLVDLRITAVAE
jgi:hypothetical protein